MIKRCLFLKQNGDDDGPSVDEQFWFGKKAGDVFQKPEAPLYLPKGYGDTDALALDIENDGINGIYESWVVYAPISFRPMYSVRPGLCFMTVDDEEIAF